MIRIEIEDSVPKQMRHFLLGAIHGTATRQRMAFGLSEAAEGESLIDAINSPDGRTFAIYNPDEDDQEEES